MKTTIIALMMLFICIVSCTMPGNIESLNMKAMFDPPFDIATGDLKTNGYSYVKDWRWYHKNEGDTSIIYQAQHEEDPIFARVVDISNWQIRDSVGIRKFVQSQNGKLASPIFKHDGALKFFVQGKVSGLYSQCVISVKNLQIIFHYPDHCGTLRSKFRRPTSDGFVTEFGHGNMKSSFETK